MKKISAFSTLGFCLAALWSCTVDDAQIVPHVELGAPTKVFVVSAEGGSIQVPYYTDSPFHVEIDKEGSAWTTVSGPAVYRDSSLTVTCEFNELFKRKAYVVLCSDNDASRRDTIQIKQKGLLTAKLEMANASTQIPGKEAVTDLAVTTNVPFSLMTVNIEYANESVTPWLESVTIEDAPEGTEAATMHISAYANTDEKNPRVASAGFSFTDGWGDKVEVLLNIIQKNAKEEVGTKITFEEFLNGYSTGKPIEDYVMIEGYVVSNVENLNAGEPNQKTTSSIDYEVTERTVYIESLDGTRGASFETVTPADNIFKQYDKVSILVNGLTAKLKETPERVVVTGLKKSMVVSQEAGSKSSIPVRELYLNELKPTDIFTYVSLKDVEIPIRKGSICPINEGYAISTNAHRIAKYPLLIRDINGDASFIMTNTNCKYRSDGTRKPYGSGKISGVIVHEQFSRFEWRNGADPADMDDDPTLGYIGEYQIRPQTKDDIWGQMNDSVEDSFSALLTEYRFYNPDTENCVLRPTYGTNGWMTHTYQEKYIGTPVSFLTSTYRQYLGGGTTYPYLGPIGNNASYYFGMNVGNKNGCGIILDPEKEHWYTADASSTSTTAIGKCVAVNPDGTIEYAGPYAENAYCGYGAAGWSSSNATENIYAINYTGSSSNATSMRGKACANGSSWTSMTRSYWWDYETNRPYAWMFNFSTAGISTNHISIQVSMMNQDQSWYAPRNWCLEWSEVDSMDPKDDEKWHRVKEFTVPDVSTWSNTLYSSIVAFKHINIDLPLEILGKDNVYVRIMPYNDHCSSGADYEDTVLSEKPTQYYNNTLEYFAVRYNK